MQDRPSAEELIAAVASFLEQELIPTITDPRLRFRGLVAANLLAVVARELDAGDAPLLAARSQLQALLGHAAPAAPDRGTLRAETAQLAAELAARIRAGAFDEPPDFIAALDAAEQLVAEKLRVANPRYLAKMAHISPIRVTTE
jgi:Domain of unknown function (DUF6285)